MKKKIALPRFLLLLLLVLESGLLLLPTSWISVSRMRGQGTALVGSVIERQDWRVVVSCSASAPMALSLDGEDGLRETRMIDCDGRAQVAAVEPARTGSVYLALTSLATGVWQVSVQEPLQW